jgi:hypothetical protein
MFLFILVYVVIETLLKKNGNKLLIKRVKNIHNFIILNMESTSNIICNNYLKSLKTL